MYCLNQGFYSCTNTMIKKQVEELGTEPLCFLGKRSTTELNPQPLNLFLDHGVCAGMETLIKTVHNTSLLYMRSYNAFYPSRIRVDVRYDNSPAL